MKQVYCRNARIMSALSTPMRLQILDLLSCGELCASEIQNAFSVTQPTMSYHMKLLVDAGIVSERNEGRYIFYSLNQKTIKSFLREVEQMTQFKTNCICNKVKPGDCRKNRE